MKRNLAVFFMLAVAFALMSAITPAWAALGDNIGSVESDAQAFHGQHTLVARTGFNLHQITMQDGSVINEYVSPAGTVFGVSWKGHRIPDFHQLLGTYLTNMQQGQRTNVIPRRGVTIYGTDFVLTSFGRMMNFQGRAWAPSLIPSNLTPQVVQ